MSDGAIFSREELARLKESVSGGRTPTCPRCDRELVSRTVAPRSDVSYVRTRIWWLCESCGRSAVLDAATGSAPTGRERGARRTSRGRTTLGWREWVGLPGMGITRIKAKVDTGARSSALHAAEIEEVDGPDGPRLRFTVYPVQRSKKAALRVEAPLVDRRGVRSSSGRQELRPVVRVEVEIAGIRYPTELTLARRDQMGFRMLLGRTALRGRFLVDPGRSFLQNPRRPTPTKGTEHE